MSYPSIHAQLEEQGVTPESATDAQMQNAFIGAFKEDLPLGFAKVQELVLKLHHSDKRRVMLSIDPTSPEGQQFARLLGPDIPRRVVESHFEVAFGFYNCCTGVVSADRSALCMSAREQVMVQHPRFVDC